MTVMLLADGRDAFWYLGRSSGLVAYGLLVGSMALGLGISTRILDGSLPRGWFFEIHKFCSLLVVLGAVLHVLAFVPDNHLGLSLADLFIPFYAKTQPGPKVVAMSTLYVMVLLTASFYATRWIGQKAWRRIHYASFAVLLGATVHALWAGTDAQAAAVRLGYFSLSAVIIFLVFYRILATRSPGAKPAKRAPQV